MKVLVFVEHDIICRNFIMSGALSTLAQTATVKFIFPGSGKRMKLDPSRLNLGAPFETIVVDDVRQQTWRWILFADQLRPRGGDHERAIRRMRRATLGWKASLLLTAANLPVASGYFRRLIRKRLETHPNIGLSQLLDRERPDVVLHPSVLESVFMNDLVVECGSRSVPLVVAMNSWDNPSTKRAVVGKPDLLLVWGPQTHGHALRFMQQPESQIKVFGAAQFDVFLDPARVTREQYCRNLGVDPDDHLVLFAGSNAQTDEVATLEAIEQAKSDGRLERISVVYRPHPWGGGGKGGERLVGAKWRHIRVDPNMQAYIDGLANDRTKISLPDARDTHDLLTVVDTVVSPLSTILLEAMMHGKRPIAFTPTDAAGSALMANNLPMLHFKEFLELPQVGVAKSTSELVELLGTVLRSANAADPVEFRKAADWFVRPFASPWRSRIVDLLKDVVARGVR